MASAAVDAQAPAPAAPIPDAEELVVPVAILHESALMMDLPARLHVAVAPADYWPVLTADSVPHLDLARDPRQHCKRAHTSADTALQRELRDPNDSRTLLFNFPYSGPAVKPVMALHPGITHLGCAHCKRKYPINHKAATHDSIRDHMQRPNNGNKACIEATLDVIPKLEQAVCCRHCSQFFTDLGLFTKHMKSTHKEFPLFTVTEQQRFLEATVYFPQRLQRKLNLMLVLWMQTPQGVRVDEEGNLVCAHEGCTISAHLCDMDHSFPELKRKGFSHAVNSEEWWQTELRNNLMCRTIGDAATLYYAISYLCHKHHAEKHHLEPYAGLNLGLVTNPNSNVSINWKKIKSTALKAGRCTHPHCLLPHILCDDESQLGYFKFDYITGRDELANNVNHPHYIHEVEYQPDGQPRKIRCVMVNLKVVDTKTFASMLSITQLVHHECERHITTVIQHNQAANAREAKRKAQAQIQE